MRYIVLRLGKETLETMVTSTTTPTTPTTPERECESAWSSIGPAHVENILENLGGIYISCDIFQIVSSVITNSLLGVRED